MPPMHLVVKHALSVRNTELPTAFQGNEYGFKITTNIFVQSHAPHMMRTRSMFYNSDPGVCRQRVLPVRYQSAPTYPVQELLRESLMVIRSWNCVSKTVFQLARDLKVGPLDCI